MSVGRGNSGRQVVEDRERHPPDPTNSRIEQDASVEKISIPLLAGIRPTLWLQLQFSAFVCEYRSAHTLFRGFLPLPDAKVKNYTHMTPTEVALARRWRKEGNHISAHSLQSAAKPLYLLCRFYQTLYQMCTPLLRNATPGFGIYARRCTRRAALCYGILPDVNR